MSALAREKLWAGTMAIVVAVLLTLVVWRGVLLVATGDAVGAAIGVAVIVIASVGAWVLWRSLQFGVRMQAMGRQLAAEGGLPVDDLPRRPSGRADRPAADAVFQTRRAEAEASPDDWRVWYRLALAYDDAGDRSRAREAARKAIALRRAR